MTNPSSVSTTVSATIVMRCHNPDIFMQASFYWPVSHMHFYEVHRSITGYITIVNTNLYIYNTDTYLHKQLVKV